MIVLTLALKPKMILKPELLLEKLPPAKITLMMIRAMAVSDGNTYVYDENTEKVYNTIRLSFFNQ
ncbi:MAG: hypothetical protein Q4P17_10125 [Methanobacterium sp.]|nr:hypothetical protein [Methanobacterium sp.]